MRIAVLVINYILVGIIALALIGASGQSGEALSNTIAGIVMLTPVAVVNLIYAHGNNIKKGEKNGN